MRIVKDWNVNRWKFTLFHYQMKYSLKIEDGSTEQWYKFKDIDDSQVAKIITTFTQPDILKSIGDNFNYLNSSLSQIQNLLKSENSDEEEFDDII